VLNQLLDFGTDGSENGLKIETTPTIQNQNCKKKNQNQYE